MLVCFFQNNIYFKPFLFRLKNEFELETKLKEFLAKKEFLKGLELNELKVKK